MLRRSFITLALLVSSAVAAQAAGDAKAGAAVFKRCAVCHTNDKGGGDGLGPNLFGVVGRKAGMVAGFSYSAAMKNSGIVWTADKLTAYVAHPAQVVPANRMAFAGVIDPGQQADVVAYLATLK